MTYQSVYKNPLGAILRSQEAQRRINTCNRKSFEIGEVMMSLSEDKRAAFNESLNTLLFAADLFDTHLRNVKSTIQSVINERTSILVFEDINKAIHSMDDALRKQHKRMSDEFQEEFADEASRIEEYFHKRIPVFTRKLKRIERRKK